MAGGGRRARVTRAPVSSRMFAVDPWDMTRSKASVLPIGGDGTVPRRTLAVVEGGDETVTTVAEGTLVKTLNT